MIPIAKDSEALELLALNIDKFSREGCRFFADFEWRKPAGFFDDFVFDGQSVTIPTRDIWCAFAQHRLRFHDDVFENFVERGAHVDVAVGKGRAVVQNEQLSILARFLDLRVKPRLRPRLQYFRLARGQVCLHRKIRAWQVERVFVILAHWGAATLPSAVRQINVGQAPPRRGKIPE